MALNFGDHPDVVFDNAPLVQVLCQVKFPPILSLMTRAGVAGFQTALRDEYPVLDSVQAAAKVQMGAEAIAFSPGAPVWRFHDAQRTWIVGLAADFISLETSGYTDIEEFLERFSSALSVLRRTVRPADTMRIGMRKVNEFQENGRDTRAFLSKLRPEVLGLSAVDSFPAPISGAMSQMHFVDDDTMLAVRHGLSENSDEEKMSYVLDMDYFTERPHAIDGGDSITNLLRHFSDGMTSFFHWALVDSYKAELGPQQRAEGGSVQ